MKLSNPYLALVIGVLGVSSSAILVKFTSAPPVIIALYRMLFTFALLLPFTIKNNRHDFKTFSPKEYFLSFLSGFFLTAHFVSWFASLKYTSVASATVLVDTHPIFVIIISFILWREILPKKAYLGVSVALAGTVILSWGDLHLGGDSLKGDILALIGAFAVAIYYLCGRFLLKKMALLPYTTLVYGFSALILLVTAIGNKYPLLGYKPKDYLIFFSLAFFCTLLGHSVLNWALKFLPTSAVSVSVLGEPVVASLLAFVIFQETLSVQQLWGSFLILGGIYYFVRNQNPSKL